MCWRPEIWSHTPLEAILKSGGRPPSRAQPEGFFRKRPAVPYWTPAYQTVALLGVAWQRPRSERGAAQEAGPAFASGPPGQGRGHGWAALPGRPPQRFGFR